MEDFCLLLMIKFNILTIFPHIFESYFSESIIKRALKKKLTKIKIYNLRDYTIDKHQSIDDRPYGGGPGMVLKIEPIYKCLKEIYPNLLRNLKDKKRNSKIILLTPRGKNFNQRLAMRWSKLDQLDLICGHYEGIDERVNKLVDERISIGSYVLTGGELAAMIIVDAVIRLIPGVLGNIQSLKLIGNQRFKYSSEFPQYTRPEVFCPTENTKWRVPKVLLSGDHKRIEEWRKKQIGK